MEKTRHYKITSIGLRAYEEAKLTKSCQKDYSDCMEIDPCPAELDNMVTHRACHTHPMPPLDLRLSCFLIPVL
jgi:hypothetical protein